MLSYRFGFYWKKRKATRKSGSGKEVRGKAERKLCLGSRRNDPWKLEIVMATTYKKSPPIGEPIKFT